MGDILAHRGPDGAQMSVDKNVGLGHRMLWTTPESLKEQLPLVEESSRLTITADARIDNREELYGLLEIRQPLAAISDSELILAAYAKWGEQCPARLLGDFAFAIWDDRNQKLFSARDYFGVKSFFYHLSPKLFAFATELKALLTIEEVPQRLNEVRVADYLASVFGDVEATFYQDILRLPPSHSLTITPERTRMQRFWNLDPRREISLKSSGEYAEALRELFVEAVRCRMRSSHSIGSMLSGGLDSSSIACVAQMLLTKNSRVNFSPGVERQVHTFSAVFKQAIKSDESSYIDTVLSNRDFKPHFLKADSVGPLIDAEKRVWHQDEPLAFSNMYINWSIYGIAKESGVRVMLDGFDGDTTISHGTWYMNELARANDWFKWFRHARGHAANVDEAVLPLFWVHLWHYQLNSFTSRYRALRPARNAGRRLMKRAIASLDRVGRKEDVQAVANPQFLKRVGFHEHVKAFRQSDPYRARSEREFHFLRLNAGVLAHTLEMHDKMAGAFDVEVRYPFWDRRLAEFCLAVPAEQKIECGMTRMIMRRAMEGILPRQVQWRGNKGELSDGLNYGLLNQEGERIKHFVTHEVSKISQYVDTEEVQKAYGRFLTLNVMDCDVMALSKSMFLALWLQHKTVRP